MRIVPSSFLLGVTLALAGAQAIHAASSSSGQPGALFVFVILVLGTFITGIAYLHDEGR